MLSRLDPWLYRYPFEGRSARRYASLERCGFGDFDDRLLARLAGDLEGARRFLDLGAGPGTFARRLAARRPELATFALEPSAAFTAAAPAGVHSVRARGETLPLSAGSIDVALCLSSIRHVKDRRATLAELRRVVAPAGAAWIVELDPRADRARIREHTRRMRSLLSRLTFGPLVVRTSPDWTDVAALARSAGWARAEHSTDELQPVYLLRLSGGDA